MTWRDYVIVALVQVVIVALGLVYLQHAYPPMAEYVNAVAGTLSRQVGPIEERVRALEDKARATVPPPGRK